MSADTAEAEPATCPHCHGPMPPRKPGGGRLAVYCSEYCRKTNHRLATNARSARASLPTLRGHLDSALAEVERAVRRLHASGLDPEEMMLRPGVRPELPGDVDYALRTSLDRLRYAARAHREAVEVAKSHPAGAAAEDDDE